MASRLVSKTFIPSSRPRCSSQRKEDRRNDQRVEACSRRQPRYLYAADIGRRYCQQGDAAEYFPHRVARREAGEWSDAGSRIRVCHLRHRSRGFMLSAGTAGPALYPFRQRSGVPMRCSSSG